MKNNSIVDRDSGNLYPIYILKKNCGVSFWTCWREISGDRVALFPLLYLCLCEEIMSYSSEILVPQKGKKDIFLYNWFKLKKF